MPPGEIRGDDPASLARAATRAEMRQPGTIERAWGGNAGFGLGSWFMTTLAASFIGTAIAQSFFDNDPGGTGVGALAAIRRGDAGTESAEGDGSDTADAGFDDGGGLRRRRGGGDFGGGDFGGGDFGGFEQPDEEAISSASEGAGIHFVAANPEGRALDIGGYRSKG